MVQIVGIIWSFSYFFSEGPQTPSDNPWSGEWGVGEWGVGMGNVGWGMWNVEWRSGEWGVVERGMWSGGAGSGPSIRRPLWLNVDF